jgi:hypothetical protein
VLEHHLSERRACRLVGLSRDSYRHPPETDQMTRELMGKIGDRMLDHRALSELFEHRRFIEVEERYAVKGQGGRLRRAADSARERRRINTG